MSFYYQSPEAIEFERRMRKAMVENAQALDASGAKFATFEESRGNEVYWMRTDNGGFQLKDNVLPSDGIRDIFRNGYLYGFECATAVVVVLYKATLDMIGDDAFNRNFNDLYLWNWHLHSNMKLIRTHHKSEMLPGDLVYFKSPDHDPDKPEWQGENAVLLGDDRYFGHGIGIESAEGIITSLNVERVPGSTTSAYLTDDALHPDFEYLQSLAAGRIVLTADRVHSQTAIFARIGVSRRIYK
ncbi:protein-glutamine gamma-glutamyltransferase [Paenibacillus sp. sgz500958]|uniref:protein-glutamine gamma-glutamyltransferase n=1 Tax=Paenibacillus sp. sgz500958 TaxID=3242475 RepID=UPI0036D3D412